MNRCLAVSRKRDGKWTDFSLTVLFPLQLEYIEQQNSIKTNERSTREQLTSLKKQVTLCDIEALQPTETCVGLL
jgi:hypothetical protein